MPKSRLKRNLLGNLLRSIDRRFLSLQSTGKRSPVVGLKVFINCFLEFRYAVEITILNGLGGDLREEAFYQVQPRCMCWDEV